MTEERNPSEPLAGRPIDTSHRRTEWQLLVARVRVLPIVALDALLVAAAYAGSLALKFDGDIPRDSIIFYGQVIGGIALAYIAGNYVMGIYRTAWQYASLADAINLAVAVGIVSILLLGVNSLLSPRHIPLTVSAIAPPLIFLSMSIAKLWPRLRSQAPFSTWGGPTKRVLIAGAGHTGQMLAREFLQHPEWEYRPVGFIDDDPRKRSIRIHGLVVLGDRSEIPEVVKTNAVDVVALAMPSAGGAIIRDYVGLCQRANVAVRTVPGVPEMVHARTSGRLREITVDDLLSADEQEIDADACRALVEGKSILITGAAGYLSQELARQLLTFAPRVLHLLDTNETGLYEMQRELSAKGDDVRMWITDIVYAELTERTLRTARPDVVIHTAAYKNIPVMEQHPEAAFRVNVVGTMNLARAAAASGVGKFILVSTNKAAELDSVYGASKRIGELLLMSLAGRSETSFSSVRLHNVMGSRGSVVPLFLRQIERGGPVQLTHAEATRYFMSPQDAVRLLIQAAAMAESGRVYVLDLGQEVRIADLAEKLIRLRGYQPGKDIEIVYSGLRPGEQLQEEPLERRGRVLPSPHPKIFLTDGEVSCAPEEITDRIEQLQRELPESHDEIVARLHALARIDLRDVQPARVGTEQ